MKTELKNIFGTQALEEHFRQYQYIFHPDYYQHTITQQLSDVYEVRIEEYNHTYTIGKNFKKSVSCQIARVYTRVGDTLIYEHRNYFGKLCVACFMWEVGQHFLFFSCDLNGYVFYNIGTRQEYGYYSQGYADETLRGISYWYVTGVLFNPKNHWLAVNGQDVMNCSFACLLDLSDLNRMPYPMVSLSEVLSADPPMLDMPEVDDFATVALGWNEDNSINVLVGEENAVEVILPQAFYKQPQALFKYKKRNPPQKGDEHGE